MMSGNSSLARLREVISENLRVQRDSDPIDYISVGTALQDAKAKQNHTIFGRRGCGKTLLLHHSARTLRPEMKSIYLNCEDFKRHSFPNVLIEILSALFRELDRNLTGWFGRKRRSKKIIQDIVAKLGALQHSADVHDEEIRRKSVAENRRGPMRGSILSP
jgi:Cdc6-like AAA superfamily ATPase